ncbi:MAG: hypothetical protein Q9216_006570 [Gyalolechia sp. 2 TL-2023]
MQADLQKFQLCHFSGYAGSDAAWPAAQQTYGPIAHTGGTLEHASDESGVDDLGFYPDGVKRTLTDEQISMFRHSEVYSLLRERQLQKENWEADGASNPNPPETGSPETGSPLADLGQTIGEAEDTQANVKASNRMAMAGNTFTKKRKHNADGDQTWQSATSRRHIRELDDAVPDAGLLDYGDGPDTDRAGKYPKLQEASPRARVDYEDQEDQTKELGRESSKLPKQGRKIWWPTIG